MIAPNSVSYGVYLLCASDALLGTSGGLLTPANPFNVGFYGQLGKDASRCPWIEVHQTKREGSPYVLGKPQFQENKFDIRLFHGDASWLGSSGDAFRRVWDAEQFLVHSLFSAPGNVALSGLVAPGVSLVLQSFTSELYELAEDTEQVYVTNLLTLHYLGHG